MSKIFNKIINIGLIIFLVLLQVGFFSALPYPINNFNLLLSLIIFTTVVLNFELALWYALGAGILIEMFSVYPYGVILISFFITAVLINWLFQHFFTNRSLYSLMVLSVIGIFFYNLLLLILNYSLYFLKLNIIDIEFNRFYFYHFLWQLGLNLALLVAAFFIFNFIKRKFKLTFSLEH